MRIDHVIYATEDLDAAAARVEAAIGVAAVPGGRHDGIGTHNKIVPLGQGYIELLAIADPDEAAGSALGSAIQRRLAEVGEGLMAWAVVVDDVETVAERNGTEITTISRQGLSAHLTGLAEAMRDPYLPFFITRDDGIADPSAEGDAGGITWIEVAGDADQLRAWLGDQADELPLKTADGPPGVLAVGIGADGELRR